MSVEYKIYVNNIVADFPERKLSVIITTEQAVALLNDELAWKIDDDAIELHHDSGKVVATWPLRDGKMFYETFPQKPTVWMVMQ